MFVGRRRRVSPLIGVVGLLSCAGGGGRCQRVMHLYHAAILIVSATVLLIVSVMNVSYFRTVTQRWCGQCACLGADDSDSERVCVALCAMSCGCATGRFDACWSNQLASQSVTRVSMSVRVCAC